jgi:hypothetical protein
MTFWAQGVLGFARFWKSEMPGNRSGWAGSEGVGEHVRTNFQPGQVSAGETAERERPHRTKKTLFLLPDRPAGASALKFDPAV